MEHLHKLWDKLNPLLQVLQNMTYAEGLKPLKLYDSIDELLSMGGSTLLQTLQHDYLNILTTEKSVYPFLNSDGTCKSLNYDMQPLIGIIYGPTGCGKSQLLRNLMSSKAIRPTPETVFFITPQIDMMPPQEILAWESQICEGNYEAGPQNTFIPQSGCIKPEFIQLNYEELLKEHNHNVAHPNNIFAHAAKKGPIAIIMDECMEELGGHKSIAKFFHAFPSKLHDKFPQCTGYTLLVVLHNMNPRKDLAGNISTLKIQAKMHIISPKMHPSQLSRFINTYTKSLPLPICLLLKDIFNFHATHCKYDWIIYNCNPLHEALQWIYMNPVEGLMPMYLNVQTLLYTVLQKIHKTKQDRERWTRYYQNKKLKH